MTARTLCNSAAEILTQLGARPHTCTSGATAVEMASRAHAAGEDFFAAIIDYKMPSMNGIETAVKIREATDGKVPELLVSAYDWNDIEEEAKATGLAGFISKPLFKSTLHRALTRLAGGEDSEDFLTEEALPSIEGMRVLLAEDAQRCEAAGMNAHLAKPIDATLLLRMLASINEERKSKA